jgi:16S rRNA (cytosine967-C5)-methyltransferase
VAAIPGFREGRVSVQDAGAQLAAEWLGAEPGMRVLDACAAPGGKTGHLLERTPGLGSLLAIDVDGSRLRRVYENLERLGLDAQLMAADVRDTAAYWDGQPFDRILLDAPCSSTGVIRRHPDIKLLRRESDIPVLAATQREMLVAAFRMLAPGGRLLYCTCSVLPQENSAVVEGFLQAETAARLVPLPGAGLGVGDAMVQLLPGAEAGTDGFHYACIEKATAGP